MVPFDLRERIFASVLKVIDLIKVLPDTRVNRIFFDQIIRSATSIGANYEEADGTPTRKDFAYKMTIVKKEAKETKYWLRVIKANNDTKFSSKIEELENETEELIRIISKIVIKSST